MHAFKLSLLCAGFLTPALTAQTDPGWIDQDTTTPGVQAFAPSKYFSGTPGGTTSPPTLADVSLPFPVWPASASSKTMSQVSLGKTGIAGLAAGEFHMCLTVSNLSTNYGGTNTTGGVIMGKVTWNTGSPVFTPTTMANNLNGSGNFGLMIDTKDGKYASLDQSSGPVLGYRANNALPFDAPVLITGVGATYVDPAVAYVDDKLVLFYIVGTGISYAPITATITSGKLTAASVSGGTTVVTINSEQMHSPTPIPDGSGNAVALWMSRLLGSDSDMMLVPDLISPQTVTSWDTAGWMNNGGTAGGRFFCADSGLSYGQLQEGQGYHLMANDNITVGTSAVLKLRVCGLSGTPSLNTSTLAVSLGVIPPVPLPGILGSFALNPSPLLLLFGGPTSINSDDCGEISIPATDTALKGVTLYFQGVANPTDTNLNPSFTNTTGVKFN